MTANAANDLFDIERKVPDALFSMELEYERNGNIESATWKSTYHLRRQYAYSYDALNRISSADYSILPSPGVPMPTYGKGFTADNFTYDALGNILSLTRYAQLAPNTEAVLIDDLRYQYHASLNPGDAAIPNLAVASRPDVSRLITIDEKGETDFAKDNGFEPGAAVIGDDYGYDSAGNLIDDPYKGIAITYNHLNLPEEIDGIKILYDASGRKWAMEYPDGTIRLYIAGMEFVDGVFESLNLGDGRIYAEPGPNGRPSALLAEYWHKDHLGNIRVAFTDQNGDRLVQLLDDGSGNASEVNQILDYYPFGMQHPGQLCAPDVEPENAFLYNGKELLEEHGYYFYGFRIYDPTVSRFTGVDPIADKFAWVSTYNYAENEPIRNIDLHGLQRFDMAFGDPGLNAINATPQERRDYQLSMGIGFGTGVLITTGAAVAVETGVAGIAVRGVGQAGKAAFTLEKSATTVAINATTDAAIQTVMNVAEGEDPLANYDVTGLATSFLTNPFVAAGIDGALDVSSEGIEVNSVEETVVTTVVGGALGRTSGNLVESIPKGHETGGVITEFLSGVFINGSKGAAGSTVAGQPTTQAPFVEPRQDN